MYSINVTVALRAIRGIIGDIDKQWIGHGAAEVIDRFDVAHRDVVILVRPRAPKDPSIRIGFGYCIDRVVSEGDLLSLSGKRIDEVGTDIS